jgi:hypothetical protein
MINAGADVINAAMEPARTAATGDFILNMILGILAFVIIVGVMCLIANSQKNEEKKMKSNDYRKLITDMFVAGKVRNIATEEKVDLDAEYKRFKKWEKKDYLKGTDLDNAVEVNLRDKITEQAEKEIDNIK